MSYRDIILFCLASLPSVSLHELAAAGWNITTATSLPDAKATIRKKNLHVGLILLDDPHKKILGNIEDVLLASDTMEWVALLPPACRKSPVFGRFIAENCYDFHMLPIDIDRLKMTVGHAYGKAELKKKVITQTNSSREYEMVGKSSIMLDLFRKMRKMAGSEAPILITGESGTGKEVVAHLIHSHSARANAPFVAVNCGALPTHLIQTELFGHEKGSFTGAIQRKSGRIESAADGTIFLDEIGDLPLDLQTNLLRFLQEKTIERVGSHCSINIDARVIAATNVDLEKAVEQGRFRMDLYYRLNVLNLKMPPLRERLGDIELLATAFLKKFCTEKKTHHKHFSQQALYVMNMHTWPGNVREMTNRIQRAVVMSETKLITPSDLGLEKRIATRNLLSLEKAREKAEREAIQYSLICNRNNFSAAARQLGVSRVTLYRMVEKFQI